MSPKSGRSAAISSRPDGRAVRAAVSALFAALLVLAQGPQAAAQGSSTWSANSLGPSGVGSLGPSQAVKPGFVIKATEVGQTLHVAISYSGLAPSTEYSLTVELDEWEGSGGHEQTSTQRTGRTGAGVWEFSTPMRSGGNYFECYSWILWVSIDDAQGKRVADNWPEGELMYATCGSSIKDGLRTELTVPETREVLAQEARQVKITANFGELDASSDYLIEAVWIDGYGSEYGRSGQEAIRTDASGSGTWSRELSGPDDSLTECLALGVEVEIRTPDGKLVRSSDQASYWTPDWEANPDLVTACPRP